MQNPYPVDGGQSNQEQFYRTEFLTQLTAKGSNGGLQRAERTRDKSKRVYRAGEKNLVSSPPSRI